MSTATTGVDLSAKAQEAQDALDAHVREIDRVAFQSRNRMPVLAGVRRRS